MSDYIDTREGWREVDPEDAGHIDLAAMDPETGRVARAWVRDEPAPLLLPTEPFTVIRVTWARGVREFGAEDVLTLHDDGWYDAEGAGWEKNSATLARSITGFEVLAEPHPPEWVKTLVAHQVEDASRTTAKAVLDDVRSIRDVARGYGGALDAIARDFGVES